MRLTKHDWQMLQFPLLALGLALIAAVSMAGYTGRQKDLAMQAMQAQQNQLNQARQRFQTSGAERETIVKYSPLYLGLIQQGFIGEERRIEWIDDLRTINRQHKLFGINYSIGAQETYKPLFSLNTGPFTLHRSVMKIDAPLLHEGDLLTIANALAARSHAPFMLRDCAITRLTPGASNRFVPNLNASCEIDWLTITEPPRAGGKS